MTGMAQSGVVGSGWPVVWTAFAVAVFGWGVGFYGPTVYLAALHRDHGWSISTLSAAITAHFLVSAALIARLPALYRRAGIARVTIGGVLLAAAGVLAWANVRETWHLIPALLLSGAGWSAMSGAALNAIIAPWFDRERPKAISMAFNGASVGGLIFAPLWTWAITSVGMGLAAVAISGAMIMATCPLAWLYLRQPPKSVGLKSEPPSPSRTLVRQSRFQTLSAAFALGLFAQIGLFSHLIARLAPGVGSDLAALAVSLTTLCAILGRTLLGWLLGETDRRRAAAMNLSIQAVGSLFLAFGENPALLVGGCVLFGLGVGNLTSLPPLIAQREFRPADAGTVVALVTAINQAVFAFAPAIFGALRDLNANYVVAFVLAAIVQVMAAVIVVGGRR
ncbi:MFS transporter [Reyranella sp.]|uniref:MFS transporter n=1 Tax=Reyranella sp. TaxID=1929291 RepID=UPI003783EE05